jgi:AAA ATPase domain
MRLLRVQVPNFRALKDVDISFEPDFVPNIFPIGSQNGGGKSTLFQLIFTLLHCSQDPDRLKYLENLLSDFNLSSSQPSKTLATFQLSDEELEVTLSFFVCRDNDAQSLLSLSEEDMEHLRLFDGNITLSNSIRLGSLFQDQNEKEKLDEIARKFLREIERRKGSLLLNSILSLDSEEIHQLGKLNLDARPKVLSSDLKQMLEKKVSELDVEIDYLSAKIDAFEGLELALEPYFKKENLTCICGYHTEENTQISNVLMCRVTGADKYSPSEYLDYISEKVFLCAPSSQVFLFSSQKSRRDLFRSGSKSGYDLEILHMEKQMPNFLTYGFINTELLLSLFKDARDKDFRNAIATNGGYGTIYKSLICDLEALLGNKNVVPSLDLEGVEFHKQSDGDILKLSAEDLSHGELKRLSIYAWLKYLKINESIVLMDEVELALHPDWQYQIVSDLATWGPTNQYLLATHSYELCQALTPAHVKEIPPVLLKQPVANP